MSDSIALPKTLETRLLKVRRKGGNPRMRCSLRLLHSGLGVSASKRLEWSPMAGRDLLVIEAFYAEYSQETADRVMGEIRYNATQLETH